MQNEKEKQKFCNLELSKFLNSDLCPSNLKNFFKIAEKHSQIDNYIGADVVAAGFISNFLFWLFKWTCRNFFKFSTSLINETVVDTIKNKEKFFTYEEREYIQHTYNNLIKKIKKFGEVDLSKWGIDGNLPQYFIEFIIKNNNLSYTEKFFLSLWEKVIDISSKEFGIYVVNWPRFVDFKKFKSKLIKLSYPEVREDIERLLEKPNKNEIEYMTKPFYHPNKGTCILYDEKMAKKWYHMKDILTPPIETLLSYAIHESIGHGFFFQHTAIGKKLSDQNSIQIILSERIEPATEINYDEKTEESSSYNYLKQKDHWWLFEEIQK